MAKLKGPLLSLGATQQIGKTLVFFPWKGLDVVREYVVPSNPRTAGQTTQRGYVTAAAAAIHAAQALAAFALDADDLTAYSLLGSTHPTPRTWWNEVVKLWIDAKVAGMVPVVYSNGTNGDPAATAVDLDVWINEETGSTLAAGKFYLGKTKTSLIHSSAATVIAGTNVDLTDGDISSWAAVGDKIFWQFRPDAADPCEGANSGIYTFTAT